MATRKCESEGNEKFTHYSKHSLHPNPILYILYTILYILYILLTNSLQNFLLNTRAFILYTINSVNDPPQFKEIYIVG